MPKPNHISNSLISTQVKPEPNINFNSNWQSEFSTVQAANKHLLETGKFSDITFVVGEENVKIDAHKFILITRSSVFETMLERWNPGNSEILLPDTSFSAFYAFVLFLYTNEFCVQVEDALEVMYLAHQYNVVGLFDSCSYLLKSAVNYETAIEIYQVARILEQKELEEVCLEFIQRNATSVLQNISETTTLGTLITLLESEKLDADELVVFEAVIRWAELICQESNLQPTAQNKRIAVDKLASLIRFPLMPVDVFIHSVTKKHHGFLNNHEELALLEFMSCEKKTKAMQQELPFDCTSRFPRKMYCVIPNYGEMDQMPSSEVHSDAAVFEFSVDADVFVTSLELNPEHVNYHFLRDLKTRLHGTTNQGLRPVSFVQIVRMSNTKRLNTLNSSKTAAQFELAKYRIKTLDLDPVRVRFEWPVKILAKESYKIVVTNSRIRNSAERVVLTGKSSIPIQANRTQRTLCTYQFYSTVADSMEREGFISKIHFTT